MIQVENKTLFCGEVVEIRVIFKPDYCSDLVDSVTSQALVAQLKGGGRARGGCGEKSGWQPPQLVSLSSTSQKKKKKKRDN